MQDPYCERSAALGEGFPDLIGGVIGLTIGLVRGSAIAGRRLVEQAIWMDHDGWGDCRCGCHTVEHRYVISDQTPCGQCGQCGWRG